MQADGLLDDIDMYTYCPSLVSSQTFCSKGNYVVHTCLTHELVIIHDLHVLNDTLCSRRFVSPRQLHFSIIFLNFLTTEGQYQTKAIRAEEVKVIHIQIIVTLYGFLFIPQHFTTGFHLYSTPKSCNGHLIF